MNRIVLAVVWFLFVYGTANALQQKHSEYDSKEKVREEFEYLYENVQDQQFEVVNSTPILDDIKSGQFVIYSTGSQNPILHLRRGTSIYIIRTEFLR